MCVCVEGQYLIKSKTNRGRDWVKEQEELQEKKDAEAEDKNVEGEEKDDRERNCNAEKTCLS